MTIRINGIGPARWLGLAVAALVAGCGDDGSSICGKAFSNLETSIVPASAACPGCTGQSLRAIVDGSGNSAGRIIFNSDGASAAGGSYSVDITQGPRFSGNGEPGAYITFPDDDFSSVGVSFTTYLDGEEREEIDCSADGEGNCSASFAPIAGAGGFTWYGGPSTMTFDQVNMTVTLTGAPEGTAVVVHEVCASR